MFRGRVSQVRDIYKIVSEEKLLTYYLGICSIPCTIQAPYRIDHNPSVSLYYRGERVLFNDFSSGEHGDVIDLLMQTFRMKRWEMIDKIIDELESIKGGKECRIKPAFPVYEVRKARSPLKSVEVRVRPWKQYDFEFWSRYGVDKWFLEVSNTYPISTIFFYREDGVKVVTAEKFAYVYAEFKDGKTSKKIYQPYSDRMKWISTHDQSVWDLWSLLPDKGDKLVITSSRKDAMAIWCAIDIPATSLQGEGYLPKPQVIEELKERFSEIYVLYDNDYTKEVNRGREYGRRICDLYGLKQVEIPEMYKAKDPSDLIKVHGRKLGAFVLGNLVGENKETDTTVPF